MACCEKCKKKFASSTIKNRKVKPVHSSPKPKGKFYGKGKKGSS